MTTLSPSAWNVIAWFHSSVVHALKPATTFPWKQVQPWTFEGGTKVPADGSTES